MNASMVLQPALKIPNAPTRKEATIAIATLGLKNSIMNVLTLMNVLLELIIAVKMRVATTMKVVFLVYAIPVTKAMA